ncbi:MAG: DNA repair protein RecO [Alphaproteobacteria bacterium]
MDWSDEGIVLSARRHGESAAIAVLLTEAHGRHAGLVRGGSGKRARGVLERGNRVHASWHARLEEHLGTFRCELVQSTAAGMLDDPLRLAVLSSACAVAEAALPEREPHPLVYAGLARVLDSLEGDAWGETYVRWELALLGDLGFGLDLGACAATGETESLAYVSPRTGRAVSLAAGEPYKDRLLALPGFLLEEGGVAEPAALSAGLGLTAHFLAQHVLAPHGRTLPDARFRLAERIARL